MKKTPLLQQGKLQALTETFLGKEGTAPKFLKRFVLLNKALNPDAPCHIAVHLIKKHKRPPKPYVHAHAHPTCHEIGLVIGQPGTLEYEIVLGRKIYRVLSPASVFIPAGTLHRARALRGNGAYVCMLLDANGPSVSNSTRKSLKKS